MSDDQAVTTQPPASVPAPRALVHQKRGVNVRPEKVGKRIPNLSILHKVETREDIDRGLRPGQFRYGQQFFDRVQVIFLKADDVRRFDQKMPGQRFPQTVCASANGRMPLQEIAAPPAALCDECTFGFWTNHATDKNADGVAKRVPPRCKPGFAFLGVMPESRFAPFWLVLQGTAEATGRKFIKEFNEDPSAEALWQWQVMLTTERANQEKGGLTWYLPVFTLERVLAVDIYERFGEIADQERFVPYLGRAASEGSPEGESTRSDDAPPPDHDDAPFPPDDDIPF